MYYPSVTREEFPTRGRITELMDSGKVYADLGLPPMSPENDRVMLCGSEALNAEMKSLLEDRGFTEGVEQPPRELRGGKGLRHEVGPAAGLVRRGAATAAHELRLAAQLWISC